MQETYETQGQSLGLEDPLEEGMATHSSILAWRIPWTWWAAVHGVAESDTTKQLTAHARLVPWRSHIPCNFVCESSGTLLTFPICYPCSPCPCPFLIFSSCQDPANPTAIHWLCGGWELGATRIAGLSRGGGSPQAAKEADARETSNPRGVWPSGHHSHLSHQLFIFSSQRKPVCFVHYSQH